MKKKYLIIAIILMIVAFAAFGLLIFPDKFNILNFILFIPVLGVGASEIRKQLKKE